MIKNKKFKKLLIDADLTVSGLAKMTGYSREHLSNVINGNLKSRRVLKKVTEAIFLKLSVQAKKTGNHLSCTETGVNVQLEPKN